MPPQPLLDHMSAAEPALTSDETIEILGKLINLSGKMRMLSHRTVLYVALEKYETPDFMSSHDKLGEALDKFCEIYKIFLVGNKTLAPRALIEQLHRFGAMPSDRQEVIEQFIFMARRVRKDPNAFKISELCQYLDDHLIIELERLIDRVRTFLSHEVDAKLAAAEKTARTVDKTLGMIEDLALTVRMISLNASIEAKRAGLAGAGFDVIAREIQSISERSGEAARKIRIELG